MELHIGPFTVSHFSGSDWSWIDLAYVSNRKGGMAARTTNLRGSFRSQHLTESFGQDNPADTFTCPTTGTVYYGRIVQGSDGVHSISAKEVYSKALYTKAVKEGLTNASKAVGASPAKPVDVSAAQVPEPAAV
jgi:hypothetical protein